MRMAVAAERIFDWPLDALLAAMPGEDDSVWDGYSERQERFAAHRTTRSLRAVWMQALTPDAVPEMPEDAPPALREAMLACGGAIADHYQGTLVRLILAEMRGNTSIPRHGDQGELLERTHRCHLPVITHPLVRFEIGDEAFYLPPGEVWEIDNMRRHGVVNLGAGRRVHLICNVLPATASNS